MTTGRTSQKKLQDAFEVLRVRRYSKAIIVFGKQGCGKSILANKIVGDFKATQNAACSNNISFDIENIWHRITSGASEQHRSDTILEATRATVVEEVENKKEWIEKSVEVVKSNRDRSCLVIADNCERDYFLKGLLNVSDDVYLQYGRSTTALRAAAHRFVALCRNELRGCFFIFFTNDENFALAFDDYVNEQHKGLVETEHLLMPNNRQKEAIVRINVNRLNPVSYWTCLDRAGPEEKAAVWETLRNAETFPASFASVDNAIRSSVSNIAGRPASKCILSVFVLTNSGALPELPQYDDVSVDKIFHGKSFQIIHYKTGWASIFGNERSHKMLSTEWDLRIILSADSVTSALLSGSEIFKRLIEKSTTYHPPGTRQLTKDEHKGDLERIDSEVSEQFPSPDNSSFWAKGGVRNHEYENAIKRIFPDYNHGGRGFLGARPDLVLSPYETCSILESLAPDITSINRAIRRSANAIEFTAIKEFTADKLVAYLKNDKLSNYVNAVQEQ